MLSQGNMGAPFYRYTGQVGPRFVKSGSLVEWKWCHYIMAEAVINLNPFIHPYLTYTKGLSHWYAVSRARGCTLIPLHRPSWHQILGFGFTYGVKMMSLRHGSGWYLPQTPSYIHIMHIKSVWAIGMLSQGHVGAPLYRYTGQVCPRFGIQVHLRSENDVIT